MVKGLRRSLSRGNPGGGPTGASPLARKTYVADSLAMSVDGASGVGWGTAVIGDLPEGNILIHGVTSYLAFTGPTSGSLVDTWEGDYGVGSTPADDGTITAGDVNMIPSTALAAATAEASPRTRGASTDALNGVILDNTDGSLEVNVNLLVDDAHISADGLAFTVDGEVTLAYTVLGDD